MITFDKTWTWTLVLGVLAIAFATIGFGLETLVPAAQAPALVLLVASLGCTAGAFTRVALQVRRLELEREGLLEEISQEFDRVKDRMDIMAEGMEAPRRVTPEEAVVRRRITIK